MTQELNNKIGDTLIHEVCDELIRYKAKLAELDKVVDQRNAEIVRLNRKLAATEELLDGQFADDLSRQTGIRRERCRELLEIIRS